MAVMMQNYAKATGYTIPASHEAVTFRDDAQISPYTKDAVKALQQAGIIIGRSNNHFAPRDEVTRAEASTILHRFVDFIIEEEAPGV